MNYQISLSAEQQTELKNLWGIDDKAQILDVTAFADFFVKNEDGSCDFYNISDGEKIDVSELVAEYGLPPVNIDLGADWYHLDTVAGLTEDGWQWSGTQCLGFIKPLFAGGEYEGENMAVMELFDYHQQLAKALTR